MFYRCVKQISVICIICIIHAMYNNTNMCNYAVLLIFEQNATNDSFNCIFIKFAKSKLFFIFKFIFSFHGHYHCMLYRCVKQRCVMCIICIIYAICNYTNMCNYAMLCKLEHNATNANFNCISKKFAKNLN